MNIKGGYKLGITVDCELESKNFLKATGDGTSLVPPPIITVYLPDFVKVDHGTYLSQLQ